MVEGLFLIKNRCRHPYVHRGPTVDPRVDDQVRANEIGPFCHAGQPE